MSARIVRKALLRYVREHLLDELVQQVATVAAVEVVPKDLGKRPRFQPLFRWPPLAPAQTPIAIEGGGEENSSTLIASANIASSRFDCMSRSARISPRSLQLGPFAHGRSDGDRRSKEVKLDVPQRASSSRNVIFGRATLNACLVSDPDEKDLLTLQFRRSPREPGCVTAQTWNDYL